MSHHNQDMEIEQEAQATNNTVQRFIEGLRQLEKDRNADALLKLFGEQCSVGNVQLDKPLTGREGAARFWREYRETFGDVESRFSRIMESDGGASLEWVSTGTLKTGQPVAYRGVSILALEGDSISNFMAYFDSHPFTAHLHL